MPSLKTTQRKRKILIVDDDPDLIYLLQRLVQLVGFDFIVATNGNQAVDIATAQLPDLITMDIMLPKMDGLEATRLIRQNPKTRSIPIMAVTASRSFKDKQKCLATGFDDYLAKPFTSSQLASHIETLLMQPATSP